MDRVVSLTRRKHTISHSNAREGSPIATGGARSHLTSHRERPGAQDGSQAPWQRAEERVVSMLHSVLSHSRTRAVGRAKVLVAEALVAAPRLQSSPHMPDRQPRPGQQQQQALQLAQHDAVHVRHLRHPRSEHQMVTVGSGQAVAEQPGEQEVRWMGRGGRPSASERARAHLWLLVSHCARRELTSVVEGTNHVDRSQSSSVWS